jgi:hypothetical protein
MTKTTSSACRLVAGIAVTVALAAPAAAREEWRTEDILDERIGVAAQQSLMRVFGDPGSAAAADASAMLSALEDGGLGGILESDRELVAKRAVALGKAYWTIFPEGADAICLLEPEGEKPLIAYKKQAAEPPGRLDEALRKAWRECGIEAAPPLPYRETIRKPGLDQLYVLVTARGVDLEGATVTVDDVDTVLTQSTDADGLSWFDVAPGRVEITVSHQGCPTQTRVIEVAAGDKPGAVFDLDCTYL